MTSSGGNSPTVGFYLDDIPLTSPAAAQNGKVVIDPSLYDLFIHIKKITVDDAVNIICHTVRFDHFKTTLESKAVLDDMLLAARVKVALIDQAPNAEVLARQGDIFIKMSSSEYRDEKLVETVTEITHRVPGVKSIDVNVVSLVPFGD